MTDSELVAEKTTLHETNIFFSFLTVQSSGEKSSQENKDKLVLHSGSSPLLFFSFAWLHFLTVCSFVGTLCFRKYGLQQNHCNLLGKVEMTNIRRGLGPQEGEFFFFFFLIEVFILSFS